MNEQLWSWILTAVGMTGFILAGRKVWWCWYVNLFCQVLWYIYSITTQQWGFFVGALFYTAIFARNAYVWTKERNEKYWTAEVYRKAVDMELMTPNEVQDIITDERYEEKE